MVIIGDSLGIPRETAPYEKTYTYLLKQKLPEWDIINNCIPGNTSRFQKRTVIGDIELYNPDVVVIHLGIADCAPRLFTINQRRIIDYLGTLNHSLQQGIIAFFSKHRYFFTSHFPKVYVKKEEFQENMTFLLNSICEVNALPIIINIAMPNPSTILRSYNIRKNIMDYNEILDRLSSNLIDVFSLGDKALLHDDHHLNYESNRYITNKVVKIVNAYGKNV